jgi:formate/nitrite transporter FocA (FNT family)
MPPRLLERFKRREKETEPDKPANQKNLSRPSAEDIYAQVAKNARQELKRPTMALILSGFGGGIFIGLSALGPSIVLALLGTTPGAQMIARMFYPMGFIVVMIGRSQLFTENTLYPVALVLAEKREALNTLRLWSVVLPSNVAGALVFAALCALTPALSPGVVSQLSQLGLDALAKPTPAIFWSGVMAGWIIATAAWLVSSSHSITGSIAIIWMLMFIVALGNFAHCIATSGEILTAVLGHRATWPAYGRWFGPAVLGNICGGVGMVTILQYGQVMFGKEGGSV